VAPFVVIGAIWVVAPPFPPPIVWRRPFCAVSTVICYAASSASRSPRHCRIHPRLRALQAPCDQGCPLPTLPAVPINATPLLSHPPIVVSSDPQPTVAHIEEPEQVEALTLELQLAIVFDVLHHLEMAEKSRSLFM
jgi:hypothetical protein